MAPKAKGSAKAASHRAERLLRAQAFVVNVESPWKLPVARRSVSPNPSKPSPKAKGRASSEAPGRPREKEGERSRSSPLCSGVSSWIRRPTGDADEPGPKILEA